MSKFRALSLLLLALFTLTPPSPSQTTKPGLDSTNMVRMHTMLEVMVHSIRAGYYDPKFHGVDIDARYKYYDTRISQATSVGDAMRFMSAFLNEFHDSHLFFTPPMRGFDFDSGYRMQIIGDKCFVTHVRPESDAAQHLHPGDEVLALNHYPVNQKDIDDVEWYFHVLAPASVEVLDVRAPDGTRRTETVHGISKAQRTNLDINRDNKMLQHRGEIDDEMNVERLMEVGDLTIWNMPEFDMSESTFDSVMRKIRKHSNLIIDLRGNPGGSTELLSQLVGNFFDHDVKIADRVGRKSMKPIMAKHVSSPYTGKLIVLVDRGSSSCSELFARTMQLEKRGTIVGDTSNGKVMEAIEEDKYLGADSMAPFGMSITDANLIMPDGVSLENHGVTPDRILTPGAQALASGNDGVLSEAAYMLGIELEPAAFAKRFPYKWRKLEGSA